MQNVVYVKPVGVEVGSNVGLNVGDAVTSIAVASINRVLSGTDQLVQLLVSRLEMYLDLKLVILLVQLLVL